MTDWFIEYYNGTALMIKIKKLLYEHQGIQHIQIFETVDFGKMLVLDGKIQLTERDEAFYHEMLVHPAMIMHDNPSKVLIIGGGDGGAAREVLKHDPREVIIVEIDKNVIEYCKRYIGIDKGSLEDERVTIVNEDGFEFIKNTDEVFDIIIVDSTDPISTSKSLISEEFYLSCGKISDYFVTQSQSPFIQQEYFKTIIKNAKFKNRRVYIGYVPTYPLGLWSFLIGSNKREINLDLDVIRERFKERQIKTVYYTPELHVAAFELPKWLNEMINSI